MEPFDPAEELARVRALPLEERAAALEALIDGLEEWLQPSGAPAAGAGVTLAGRQAPER